MKREVKIGIFGVTMIIAAWAGIRFLKGFDIFSRNSVYYAAYDQINGVQAASPIMMKGVKIGTVTGISFDPQRSDNVVLQFTIKRQYHIPTDSEAKIYSNGLMGGKAIEINYGTARTYLQKGDTLRHRALKYIGAYAIELGRVDAIIFTGGIGENGIDFRASVVERLTALGIRLDAAANNARGKEVVISTADSPIKVMIVPTNEELVIAQDVKKLI